MFWSEVKRTYDLVRAGRKDCKERWRKKAGETPIHKSKLFKILCYYFAGEALLALLVNYYLVNSLDGYPLLLPYAVLGAGFILAAMLLKWIFSYFIVGMISLTLIALAEAFIPVSMTLKYFLARRRDYQVPSDDLEFFTEGFWMFFSMIVQVCLFFLWLFPLTALWPAEALGLDRNQYWVVTLYLAGLLACSVTWLGFKGAIVSRKEPIRGTELIAWLRNPRSLEDLLTIALFFGGVFLIFGYLAWPLMELVFLAGKALLGAVFLQGLGYGEIVADYPREQLLAILDLEKLGILQGLVLPSAEGMERSFGFNLDHFRVVRDAALPHLLPVVLLMTAVLLWMRRRLSHETPALPASDATPGMGR